MTPDAQYRLEPPPNAFVLVPASFRDVRATEWLSVGVPVVTGLVGAGVAVFSLSGRADPERLRLAQFLLALVSIGIAVTTAVTAIDTVANRIRTSRLDASTGAVGAAVG